MSEALPLVESEDLVLVRDSARGLLQDAWPASRAVAAAKDAAALKDMWRKAALQGWTALAPSQVAMGLAASIVVMQELGPEADRVQVIFVTVDPERDTQVLLAEYVPVFDKRFLGMVGEPEKIAEIAKDFRVFYRKSGDLQGHYTIDHTAGTYVFGPDGRLRLYMRHAEDPMVVAADIKALLAGK